MTSGGKGVAVSVGATGLLLQFVGAVKAEPPSVTPLMTKDLSGSPGKEVVMMIVEFGPGGADPVHRHHAQGFIYVLEGSVEMQVKGGTLVTLTPGQTFY